MSGKIATLDDPALDETDKAPLVELELITDVEYHPLSNIFPMLSEDELQELAADVYQNGLLQPIVTYEGKILDGRNRYEACKRATVEPEFTKYTGNDPLGYVVSLNMKRRA